MERVKTWRRLSVFCSLWITVAMAAPAMAQQVQPGSASGAAADTAGGGTDQKPDFDIPEKQQVGQANMLARGEMYMWNRLSDFGQVLMMREGAMEDFKAGLKNRDPDEDDGQLDPMARRTPCRQLGRGVANLSMGWWEVPRNMITITDEEGHMAGLTFGLFRGVVRTAIRTGVGVYEVATFPMGWKPVVLPEFIFQQDRLERQRWKLQSPYFERLTY